ncbi:TPA: hypothetical protein IFU62_RS13525, partial [Escherichia coli O157]
EGWVISLRQKQKKLIMLPSETMIWQPEFTDKTLSRKTGAVQYVYALNPVCIVINYSRTLPQRSFPVRAADIVNPGIQ